MSGAAFANLDALAAHLLGELESKKYILLFAYNGTGKTRLSMGFKDLGKQGDTRDTLYFNAFTEDLFTWDNDLETALSCPEKKAHENNWLQNNLLTKTWVECEAEAGFAKYVETMNKAKAWLNG
jgi:hypothetical protein